jgi:serine protease Do
LEASRFPAAEQAALVAYSLAVRIAPALVLAALLLAGCQGDDGSGDEAARTATDSQTSVLPSARAAGSSEPIPVIVDRVQPSVVSVVTNAGQGSGVIYRGFVLTNEHVVGQASNVQVVLANGERLPARVRAATERFDLAVLDVDREGLPAATFARALPDVGSLAIAMGNPLGFENTVTAGIVSAKGRSLPQENFVPFIQTDVAINPGNSGGPLFNLRGEVVGVNSQIYSRTGGFMGLSFAIPADVALDIQKQLREKGRVARGRIGVVIQEVTRDLATSFGLDKPRGALVNSVEKGSPADKAGVEATDIIISYDGKPVDASSDLPRMVGATRPGQQATLEVWRKGQTRKLNVTVGELQEERVASSASPKPKPQAEVPANRLGIVVAELTAEQKSQMKLSNGLVVTEVRPDAKAEVRKGDVLLTLVHKGQHIELKSVEQFNKLLAGMDKNSVLTLQVRRGEAMAFVTISGLTDKG